MAKKTPVLRERKTPRVRISVVELTPNEKGILRKGPSVTLTVYSITRDEAVKSIQRLFGKDG